MNGFIKRAVRAACVTGALAATQGCHHYYDVVDPCWPERYRFQAAQSVHGFTGTQAHNGHVLDQTMWNYHFEASTERLTPGGMDHLNYLARRRPHPDPMVYLQTAYDILPYDAGAPEKLSENRTALDAKRIQAVKAYLGAQTSGRGLSFEVTVHDPAEVGLPMWVPAAKAHTDRGGPYGGALQSAVGGGGGGGGGGSAGSGGGR
ncbi:MAG: hypothetical protein L0212_11355 [Acidobacteria bacterium]|nr:hypothetical protein [Acidobacteriota bacterium]